MIRPVVEGFPLEAARVRRDRTDMAMNVLQYGTAFLAIIVVALLAVVR